MIANKQIIPRSRRVHYSNQLVNPVIYKSFKLLKERLSERSFVGSIVPNNNPRIGIIRILKKEKIRQKKFSNEFKLKNIWF